MSIRVKFFLVAILAFAGGGLLVFYLLKHPIKTDKDADEAVAASPVQLKRGAHGEPMVSFDSDTQARMGLTAEAAGSFQWQPEVKGYGTVIDPSTLAAAIADIESAKTAAESSGREYERQKALADQDNASAKTVEAARASATHDQLAYKSIQTKLVSDWGRWPAEQTNLEEFISQLSSGKTALVRIDLPPGQSLSTSPDSARIVTLADETRSVTGQLFSSPVSINPDTQGQGFFFLVKDQSLTPGMAVTGFLKTSGESLNGMIVPSGAVVRYEGRNWIYLQTGTNDFVRVEIPLDRPAENGWFLSGTLAATNRIVVGGAGTMLSAELSSGNFNTGERD